MTCQCDTNIVYSFLANKIAPIQPTNNEPGYLELQCVEKGPVFLIRGNQTLAECEALVNAGSFDLAAAVGQCAVMTLEDNPGPFTVYSPENSKGFVKVTLPRSVR